MLLRKHVGWFDYAQDTEWTQYLVPSPSHTESETELDFFQINGNSLVHVSEK